MGRPKISDVFGELQNGNLIHFAASEVLREKAVSCAAAENKSLADWCRRHIEREVLLSNPTTVFEVPYPPTVNTYWRQTHGRTYLSGKAIAFRKSVIAAIGPRKPFLGRLGMQIRLHVPDKRKRDIDNVAKAVCDAFQHAGIFRDDEQIDRLTIERAPMKKGGLAVVSITEL